MLKALALYRLQSVQVEKREACLIQPCPNDKLHERAESRMMQLGVEYPAVDFPDACWIIDASSVPSSSSKYLQWSGLWLEDLFRRLDDTAWGLQVEIVQE